MACKDLLVRKVLIARLVRKVYKVIQDHKEVVAGKDHKARKARKVAVQPVQLVYRDPLDRKDLHHLFVDRKDPQVGKVLKDLQALKADKVHKDLQVVVVHQDLLDQPVISVIQVHKAIQALQDLLDQAALLALLVLLVVAVLQAHKVLQDQQALQDSTATVQTLD